MSHVHLHTDTVSLLLAPDPQGGLPVVLHWGPPLDPATDGAEVAAAVAPPVPHAGPDQPYAWRLLPLPADGWPVRPGLVGARADGADWSPRLQVTSVEVDGQRTARVTAADQQAGLRLEVDLELHDVRRPAGAAPGDERGDGAVPARRPRPALPSRRGPRSCWT